MQMKDLKGGEVGLIISAKDSDRFVGTIVIRNSHDKYTRYQMIGKADGFSENTHISGVDEWEIINITD